MSENYAEIPQDWYLDREGQFLDTTFVRTTGKPSFRLEATSRTGNNPAREFDNYGVPAMGGDKVFFEGWMFTEPSPISYVSGGARIGYDFYNQDANGWHLITGKASDGDIFYPNVPVEVNDAFYVPYGSNAWVYRKMAFTVPAQVVSDGSYYPEGQLQIPTAGIAWLQVWDNPNLSTNPAKGWFADTKLTVNDTVIPPPPPPTIPVWMLASLTLMPPVVGYYLLTR